MNECKVENCKNIGQFDNKTNKYYFIKGYCSQHYQKFKKYGNPIFEIRAQGEDRRKHILYNTYCNIKKRCYNERSNDYINYGGRGILMCDSWIGINGFSNFIKDMGARPSSDYSIDRIDNNKNYSKENCRWATRSTQNRNKRKSKNSNEIVGVHYCNTWKRWIVILPYKEKRKSFGSYKTFEKAKHRVQDLANFGITAYNSQ